MNKKYSWGLHVGLLSVICLVVVGLIAGNAFAGKRHRGMPSSGEKQNMKLVGYSDLQGRESLQVTAKGDFLYVGHHPGQHPNPLNSDTMEWNGTTVLDISNPARPVILSHIPNEYETNSRAVQVMYNYMEKGCGDFLIRNHEREDDTEWKYEIFDITDKANPVKVPGAEITHGEFGVLTAAHKGWWDEGGLFYHSSNEAGWAAQHLMIHRIELSDPPDCDFTISFVGKAWIPGQKLTEPAPPTDGVRPSMHHPIVDQEYNRVYAAFLGGGDVAAWNVSDPTAPELLWHIDTEPPGSGTHTVAAIEYDEVPNFEDEYLSGEADIEVPQPPRVYALVADEGTGGDTWRFNDVPPGVRHHARPKLYMFDITHADKMRVPFPVETWQVPNAGYIDRGGRFGPHQFNETIDGKYNRFVDKIAYVPYFNAGVRTIDISDPYNIVEVGYYVPQENERCGNMGGGQIGPQVTINDADVDHRGLIYASDRVGCGLYVLEFKKNRKK